LIEFAIFRSQAAGVPGRFDGGAGASRQRHPRLPPGVQECAVWGRTWVGGGLWAPCICLQLSGSPAGAPVHGGPVKE
jgi:hypothetical protein